MIYFLSPIIKFCKKWFAVIMIRLRDVKIFFIALHRQCIIMILWCIKMLHEHYNLFCYLNCLFCSLPSSPTSSGMLRYCWRNLDNWFASTYLKKKNGGGNFRRGIQMIIYLLNDYLFACYCYLKLQNAEWKYNNSKAFGILLSIMIMNGERGKHNKERETLLELK